MKVTAWIALFIFSAGIKAELTIRSKIDNVELYYFPKSKVKKRVHLGTLPLTIRKKQFRNKDLIHLEIYKKGFIPKQLMIADIVDKTREITIELDEIQINDDSNGFDLSLVAAEQLVDQIVVIQNYLQQRKLAKAEVLIESLEKKYKNSISIRVLRANLIFLKRDYAKSKALYSEILSDIPADRVELRKMVVQMMESLKLVSYGGGR